MSSDTAQELDASGRAPEGISYSLPKGLVQFDLVVTPNTGEFTFSVGNPTWVPDPTQQYFMRYLALPNYQDDVKVVMNASGKPYFKSIAITTTDKTKDILVNLTKGVVALGGGGGYEAAGDEQVTLARLIVDPANDEQVSGAISDFDAVARHYIRRQIDECADKKRTAGCSAYTQHQASIARKGHFVSMHIRWPDAVPNATPADCSVGLCYRPKEPLLLNFALGDTTDTKVLRLPNRAPLVAVDLKRAILVTKIQTIQFDDNGFLKSIEIDKPSEALALANLPLDLADAIADALQLRINYTNRKITNAEKEAELIDKETQLRDELQRYESSAAGGAARNARASPNPPGAQTVTISDFSAPQTTGGTDQTGNPEQTQNPTPDPNYGTNGNQNNNGGQDDPCASNIFAPGCTQ